MKKMQFMLVLCVIFAMLVGCSNAVNQNIADEGRIAVSFSANNSTNARNSENGTDNSESTTKKATTTDLTKELSTTVATTQKSTTKVEITTEKPTTTKQTTTKNTTQKHTTTKKPTTTTQKPSSTTQKQTTTKKQTTTQAKTEPYFCDEGGTHHSCDVGQIGWVNSYEAAQDRALDYIADHNASGNFRVKECFYCGKFTASVTLR